MSKLGRWVGGAPPPDSHFPDPESLQPLPHPPSGSDMFSRVLSDMMWTSQFDGIQKQVCPSPLSEWAVSTLYLGMTKVLFFFGFCDFLGIQLQRVPIQLQRVPKLVLIRNEIFTKNTTDETYRTFLKEQDVLHEEVVLIFSVFLLHHAHMQALDIHCLALIA